MTCDNPTFKIDKMFWPNCFVGEESDVLYRYLKKRGQLEEPFSGGVWEKL